MPKRYPSSDALLLKRIRDTHVVCNDVLDELIRVQQSFWKPFGRVAIELGYMRIGHVAKVLSVQATNPQKSFGECARGCGFLRTSQVEHILMHQQALVPSLADILVSEMVLEEHEVAQLLEAPSLVQSL
ncbi:MAG: hypothetical protein AB8H86_12670 [Polyangiales bacterium]